MTLQEKAAYRLFFDTLTLIALPAGGELETRLERSMREAADKALKRADQILGGRII